MLKPCLTHVGRNTIFKTHLLNNEGIMPELPANKLRNSLHWSRMTLRVFAALLCNKRAITCPVPFYCPTKDSRRSPPGGSPHCYPVKFNFVPRTTVRNRQLLLLMVTSFASICTFPCRLIVAICAPSGRVSKIKFTTTELLSFVANKISPRYIAHTFELFTPLREQGSAYKSIRRRKTIFQGWPGSIRTRSDSETHGPHPPSATTKS